MWWKVQKTIENDKKIIFSYGFESHVLDGKLEYNKLNDEFSLLRPSENGGVVEYHKLCSHLINMIDNKDVPEGQHMISIG